jgi:hypothetical protein
MTPRDVVDYWDTDDPGDRPACAIAGCPRAGTVIIFRSRYDGDPQTTMVRYCSKHLERLFDLSGGQVRSRPGVPEGAVLPPPAPEAN